MLRNKNYHMLADEENVTVLDGTAKFMNNHEIAVTTVNGQIEEFHGDRIFINTGALPIMLPIPGLMESNAILDSTAAMDQTNLPKKTSDYWCWLHWSRICIDVCRIWLRSNCA